MRALDWDIDTATVMTGEPRDGEEPRAGSELSAAFADLLRMAREQRRLARMHRLLACELRMDCARIAADLRAVRERHRGIRVRMAELQEQLAPPPGKALEELLLDASEAAGQAAAGSSSTLVQPGARASNAS
jgi:hypothetical protein